MNCRACGKPLKQSQYIGSYKSCPRCSALNGKEHVFFEYPEMFGQSSKRKTSNRPDGAQSYCYSHRQNTDNDIPLGYILCNKLKN